MARNYQHGNAHLSHSRTTFHTLIAIGTVLFLAVASGLAYSMHEESRQRAASHQNVSPAAESEQSRISSEPADKPNQEKVEAMSGTDNNSSGTTNQSNSTTTVTVNGQTTTVRGNGNVNKSYTSDDGKTKVKINVKNTVKSVQGEVTDDR